MSPTDLELLRTYEPVVRYTKGELFFPCAVDGYVSASSLWLYERDKEDQRLAKPGELTPKALVTHQAAHPDSTLYLRFVAKPLNAVEYQRWSRRPNRPIFLAPGRLARVGILSRVIDAFFNISLLLRGKVPGGTAAAAEEAYNAMQAEDPRRVYYGRVIRDGGYTVLQYLFFFTMNDWRSDFYGVNDHEADWEQIFIYLAPDQNEVLRPQWVAFASHDFRGDDLRRRWDDPMLHKHNDHPVVFAGAGSHASYFLPGEYLMKAEPAALRKVRQVLETAQRFWIRTLQQGLDEDAPRTFDAIGVPFIDYARGDGVAIGPDQAETWSPIMISDQDSWVDGYRGLWGLDTKDLLGGERAPSGPKYNRNGTVRQSWYDPLGWAGLDKVVPPNETISRLRQTITQLGDEEEKLRQDIDVAREELRTLALEVSATQRTDHLLALHNSLEEDLLAKQTSLQAMQARRVSVEETRRASLSTLARLLAGDWGDPQAHVRHADIPTSPPGPQARLAELWAALSGGLVLLSLVLLLALRPAHWLAWVVISIFIFGAIDAVLRSRLAHYLLNTTIVLAVLSAVVLLKEYWRWLLIGGVAALVILMTRENVRELRKEK
ncbi:MAG: hypothetical protein ABTQ73_11355 [Caldilineales bacterium]